MLKSHNKKKIQSVFKIANFNKTFIKYLIHLISLIFKLNKHKYKYKLHGNVISAKAFEEVKYLYANHPILLAPN